MYPNKWDIVFESGFAVCNRVIKANIAVTNRETHFLYYIIDKIGQHTDNHLYLIPACQYICQMNPFYRQLMFFAKSIDIHQARSFGADNIFGSRCQSV